MGLGVVVGVFGGVDVSFVSGVDDADTCDRAGLTVVEAISFVGMDVPVAGADDPAKLQDMIINASMPTKNTWSLLGLGCLFIFYPD